MVHLQILENVDIIALQEVWSGITPPKLNGFKEPFIKYRKGQRGGGVGFYVANHLKCKEVQSPYIQNFMETITIDVTIKGQINRFINIYRPPNSKCNKETFMTLIETLPIDPNMITIVCGDLNIDIKIPENNYILEFFQERGLHSMIDLPTRVSTTTKGTSRTIVDHIYTNKPKVDSLVLETDITDHYTTCLVLETGKRPKNPDCTIIRPLHTEKALNELKEHLSEIDWSPVLCDHTKKSFYTFKELIKSATEKCTPWTTMKVKGKKRIKEKWYLKSLWKSRTKKEKLKRKARLKNTTEAWEAYTNYRNTYNRVVRQAKFKYYNDLLEKHQKNPKKLWSVVNEVTGRKSGRDDNIGEINGKTDPKEKAEEFNVHYSKVAENLAKKIPKPKKSFEEYLPKFEVLNKMSWKPVNALDIELVIKSMEDKTSYSTDGISNKVIKWVAKEISWPMAHIINKSLELNFVPDYWKTGVIKPIFKSGDQTDPGQYRPINLLSCLSKIMEKCIAEQVYQYCFDNNIINPDQYGYMPNRNTEQLLHRLTQKVFDARNNKKHGVSVFLDLSKAFDTISHKILLKKLQHYGIPHEWFRAYFEGRSQRTIVEGIMSSISPLEYGVVQGSNMGCLLYLLYSEDLKGVTSLEKLFFADDTSLWNYNTDIKELYNDTNKKMEELQDWFAANQLSLNASKTRYILFSNEEPPGDLQIQGQIIKRVHEQGEEKSFKLVGVLLDDQLSWKYHIAHVKTKAAKALAYISTSQKSLTREVKKMLYKSLVESQFNYCLSVWGGAKETLLDPIIKLQKKAIRVATESKYNAHTMPLFGRIKSLKFQDLYHLRCAEIAMRVVKGTASPGLSQCFRVLGVQETRKRTRAEHSVLPRLFVPLAKSEQMTRLPSCAIPRIWRDLDDKFKLFGRIALQQDFKFYKFEDYNNWTCQLKKCYTCNRP